MVPEKKINVRRGNTKHETTVYVEHEEKAKNNNIEMSELEKRYQDIIVTIKKAAAKKENEAHDTRNDAKNTAAAAEAESTLVVNVAQETEEARSAAAKMTTNVTPQQHLKLEAQLLTL